MPTAVIPASRHEIVVSRCTFTDSRVVIPEELTYAEWEEALQWSRRAGGAVQWWIGDLLVAGEHRFGEEFSQALDAADYDYETLKNVKSVASRVPPENRIDLTWSHHRAVAALESDDQRELLASAQDNRWTVTELSEAIRNRRKGQPAEPTPKPQSGTPSTESPRGDDCSEMRQSTEPSEPPIPEPATPKDALGNPVPEHLWPVFATRTQFDELTAQAAAIGRDMASLADTNPGSALRLEMADRENAKPKCKQLADVVAMLKACRPYAVCCYCGGAGGDCTGCYDGWQTKSRWQSSPADKRANAGEAPF